MKNLILSFFVNGFLPNCGGCFPAGVRTVRAFNSCSTDMLPTRVPDPASPLSSTLSRDFLFGIRFLSCRRIPVLSTYSCPVFWCRVFIRLLPVSNALSIFMLQVLQALQLTYLEIAALFSRVSQALTLLPTVDPRRYGSFLISGGFLSSGQPQKTV